MKSIKIAMAVVPGLVASFQATASEVVCAVQATASEVVCAVGEAVHSKLFKFMSDTGMIMFASPYSQFTYDDALSLKDAGLVAASAAESTILDLGAGLVEGYLVLDVSAVEVASNDEIYQVYLEGSNVAAMSSGSVALANLEMGNAPAPADADTSTGRFVVPFRNEQNGTVYRYVRIYTKVSGTVATGINFSAFIAKDE